ncbi:MAG: CRISPR-associated helicase Cas3' [Promethearchaeota archaeon]
MNEPDEISDRINDAASLIFSFFQERGEPYPYLACPRKNGINASLQSHISKMLEAFNKYVRFGIPDEKIKLMCENAIIFHDIGKLNPFFQFRMWGEKPRIDFEREWSYHSLLSAILAYILLLKNGGDEAFIVANAILCHHSRLLLLTPSVKQFKEFEDEIQSNILKKINFFKLMLSVLVQNPSFLPDEFNQSLQLMAKAPENMLKKIIKGSLDKISSARLHENHDNFFKIAFVSSVLTDLDTWEAKTGRTDDQSERIIPFDNKRKCGNFNQETISNFFNRRSLGDENMVAPLLPNRQLFQKSILNRLHELECGKIYTITAPTGIGKTMGLMRVALHLRKLYQERNLSPKVIYTLPFLSICDQVEDRLKDLFDLDSSQNETLTVHHSMALHNKRLKKKNNHDEETIIEELPSSTGIYKPVPSAFEITRWRSDFVVTTTVRFFNTLLRYFKVDLIRLHRLMNSIIIIDEYHSISVEYFQLLRECLPIVCKLFNCTFILATATTPALFEESDGVIELANRDDFTSINRYELDLSRIRDSISLDNFPGEVLKDIEDNKPESVMIVVNTRRIAFNVYNAIIKMKNSNQEPFVDYLICHLSSNMTPDTRKKRIAWVIKALKEKKRVILVTTQLIEAGVDVSFHYLIRQFAPLHAIVQCAGRVNRNAEMDRRAKVKILPCDSGARIYHPTDMELSKNFLKGIIDGKEKNIVTEADLRESFQVYAKEVQNYRFSSRAYKEFVEIDYRGMCEEFNIINQDANIIVFACKLTIEQQDELKDNIQQRRRVPSYYYQYSITLYSGTQWDNFKKKYSPDLLVPLSEKDSGGSEGLSFFLVNLNKEGSKDVYSEDIGLLIFQD